MRWAPPPLDVALTARPGAYTTPPLDLRSFNYDSGASRYHQGVLRPSGRRGTLFVNQSFRFSPPGSGISWLYT